MEIFILIALIILNGLFAMSEIALVTARRARLAKLAEDGSGDLVLRLYESLGSAARCALSIGLPAAGAAETDLLEAPRGALELREGRVELDFRPFEIKTLLVTGV